MTSIPLPTYPRFRDLTGQKFGRLTCVSLHSVGPTKWNCVCDCGALREVRPSDLTKKKESTKSCGCLAKERIATQTLRHGGRRTPFYRVWVAIKTRCLNPKSPPYKNYGGRGIKICDRWKDSFENFYADMGSSYREGLEIDRINNDGDYSPENCRWVTSKENARNHRKNHFVDTPWGRVTIAEAAERSGLGYWCVSQRVRKGVVGEALFKPSRKHKKAA
jgi:hypothetical protein